MKKIFSTVAMAIVAFTAVVSMSSCQNDDPSSFNAAPQVPQTTQTTQTATNTESTNEKLNDTYTNYYMGVVSNDLMQLFDVNVTRTVGTDSKTFTFAPSDRYDDMMSTALDQVEVKEGTEESVEVEFKLKANFQEVLDKFVAERGDSAKINTTVAPIVKFHIMGTTKTRFNTNLYNDTKEVSELNQEVLQSMGEAFSVVMSKTNK